jgi:glucose/arabinose dehydrogenase
LKQLFGKILRIDPRRPSGGLPYAIPADNPFVSVAGARPEIWAYGLRNPWRFDFLPDGRLIVGDVGEQSWEEINIVAAGDNLGWNVREGRHCYKPRVDCPSAGFVDPFYEYPHDKGVSVTGGVMVWDRALPSLYGKFVFADYGVSTIDALSMKSEITPTGLRGGSPTAFGRDHDNRVYVTDFPAGRLERLASWD